MDMKGEFWDEQASCGSAWRRSNKKSGPQIEQWLAHQIRMENVKPAEHGAAIFKT